VINIQGTRNESLQAEIQGFIIQNGFLDVPAHEGGRGAGIYGNNAAIKLIHCFVRNNVITASVRLQNSGYGGGVFIEKTSVGLINLINACRFSANVIKEVTNGSGGAIGFENTAAKIVNTVVSHNKMSVEEVGIGTIYAYASSLKIEGVKIED